MATYMGMYRSNEVQADTATVESLIEEYELDGEVHIEDDTVWFGSTATTFQVWDSEYTEERTKEFLEALTDAIEEPLLVRSVGWTKLRHIPDAWQWFVTPAGDVELETMINPDKIDGKTVDGGNN